MKVLRTAIRAPLQNSICERFIGGVRRECLDHIIILGRRLQSRSETDIRNRLNLRLQNQRQPMISDIGGRLRHRTPNQTPSPYQNQMLPVRPVVREGAAPTTKLSSSGQAPGIATTCKGTASCSFAGRTDEWRDGAK